MFSLSIDESINMNPEPVEVSPVSGETPAIEGNKVSEVIQDTVEIVDQVSEYGALITHSLLFIIGGMAVIFILHKIASRYLYPLITNPRIVKVIFGALYVLILLIAVLIVLKELGFDVRIIGRISILVVLISTVGVFFLMPFLPRLPFKLGHMVEINGVLGFVDSISTFHTTVRKFDGTMVFIPNALVMATKIMNYHDVPERRVDIILSISLDNDMDIVIEQLLKIMNADERVLEKPAPPGVIALEVEITGIEIRAYCWVKNKDWLSTRSDLMLRILHEFSVNDQMSLSLPQHEIHIADNRQLTTP